jgi:hypothetical protein
MPATAGVVSMNDDVHHFARTVAQSGLICQQSAVSRIFLLIFRAMMAIFVALPRLLR